MVLCEEALQTRRLDTAEEGVAPQSVVSGEGSRVLASVDPEAPFLQDDRTVVGGVYPWHEDDADSCVSGCTGSSCRREWELGQDDFGDWDAKVSQPWKSQGLARATNKCR